MWAKRKCSSYPVVLFDFLAPRFVHVPATYRYQYKKPLVPGSPSGSSLANTASFLNTIKQHQPLESLDRIEHGSINLILSSLQQAIHNLDLLETWHQFSIVERLQLGYVLGPPHIQGLSKLISTFCARTNVQDMDRWDNQTKEAVRTLALVGAAGGRNDGLRAYMTLYLKRGDPDAVLELYQKYLEETAKRQDFPEPDEVGDDEHATAAGVGLDALKECSIHKGGRAELMLLAIIAHAMLDSFEDALQTALQDPTVRIMQSSVELLMRELRRDAAFSTKVTEYVRDLSIARWAAIPDKLSRHIENLSKDRALTQLEKLYKSFTNGITGPRPFIAVDGTNVSHSKPVVLSERIWASFLSAFLQCRHEELAERLWADMLNLGIRPSVYIWHHLLEGYREMGSVEKIMITWEAMKADGVKPDMFAFCAKIAGLFNGRQKDTAMSSFGEYQKHFPPGHRSTAVYNAVLHGLLINSDLGTARLILDQMQTEGPKPDIVSYNTFLRYYGRKGDLKNLGAILRDLQVAGERPDVHSFTTVLSTLLKAGRVDAADRLLDLMKTFGVEESAATYSAIIDQQVREGGEAGLRAAWAILLKMEQLPNAQPTEITYTALLAGIHRNVELTGREVGELVNKISRRMEDRGVRPNRVTYHILLKACLSNPEPEGLKNAMQYYKTMRTKKIPFSHDTWYIILQGLVRRREWVVADRMVDDMLKSGFQPMWGVADFMNQIRRRMSIDF